MDQEIELRRVATEAIATLADIKNTMVALVLKPAGVPADIYGPLLTRRDEFSGRVYSKRQIAPLLLEALDQRGGADQVAHRIVEIAAQWSSFHLARDEFAARATVQKAREVLGTVELHEAREAAARESLRKEELARMERERASLLRQQSELLLAMFDELSKSTEVQRRGYLLQDLLNRLFDVHTIPIYPAFTRNSGGEQIDGAFKLDGWYYLVECRWRERLSCLCGLKRDGDTRFVLVHGDFKGRSPLPSNIRDLDGLFGQVERSGRQTMGLFLSVEGWSEAVPGLLKQNPHKCVLLMEGYALRAILTGEVDLHDYLVSMGPYLNLRGEPHLSHRGLPASRALVVKQAALVQPEVNVSVEWQIRQTPLGIDRVASHSR